MADAQADLPLRSHRRLRHQQRRDRAVQYAPGHREVQGRPALGQGVDVADHLFVVADLDQPGDGVQLVGELVGLGPEQLGGARGTRRSRSPARPAGCGPAASSPTRASRPPWSTGIRFSTSTRPDRMTTASCSTPLAPVSTSRSRPSTLRSVQGLTRRCRRSDSSRTASGLIIVTRSRGRGRSPPRRCRRRSPRAARPGRRSRPAPCQGLPLDPAGQQQRADDAQHHRGAEIGQQRGRGGDQRVEPARVGLADQRDAELAYGLAGGLGVGQDRRGGDQIALPRSSTGRGWTARGGQELGPRDILLDQQGFGAGDTTPRSATITSSTPWWPAAAWSPPEARPGVRTGADGRGGGQLLGQRQHPVALSRWKLTRVCSTETAETATSTAAIRISWTTTSWEASEIRSRAVLPSGSRPLWLTAGRSRPRGRGPQRSKRSPWPEADRWAYDERFSESLSSSAAGTLTSAKERRCSNGSGSVPPSWPRRPCW